MRANTKKPELAAGVFVPGNGVFVFGNEIPRTEHIVVVIVAVFVERLSNTETRLLSVNSTILVLTAVPSDYFLGGGDRHTRRAISSD